MSTADRCNACGFVRPNSAAILARESELAGAREEIRRLRELVREAFHAGQRDAVSECPYGWYGSETQMKVAQAHLGPDVARPG